MRKSFSAIVFLLIFGLSFSKGSLDVPKRIYNDEPASNELNSTWLSNLESVKDLNVLGFYTALRELYLTNGFSVDLTFNKIILGQPSMNDFNYALLIRALELTRWEIKNGDVSMERMDALLKINNLDTLPLQPCISELANAISESSENPRAVASSILNIGKAFNNSNFSQSSLVNGTVLRNFISSQLKSETGQDFTNKTILVDTILGCHRTIGPEKFDKISDVLESLPFNDFEMNTPDSELLAFYKNNAIFSAVLDTEQIRTMFQSIREAFRNATGTKDEESLIYKLANANDPEKILSDLEPQIKAALQKSMNSSNIKSYEIVRKSLIAGSRLINNMNIENANSKCDELVAASRKDPEFSRRLQSAVDILLKLNEMDDTGEAGYQKLFKIYFENQKSINGVLFLDSKTLRKEVMQDFLQTFGSSTSKFMTQLVTYLSEHKFSLRQFKQGVSALEGPYDRRLLRNLQKYFNIRLKDNNMEIAREVVEALKALASVSSTDQQLKQNIRSVRDILRTNNGTTVFNELIAVSNLTRDHRWLDMWQALQDINIVTKGANSQVLAPFKNLESMINSTQSYQEVFLALKMLLEEPSNAIVNKCAFIKDFFTNPNLETQFGINTNDIRKWREKTIPVDALVYLLKESGSFSNLQRLLGYHASNTTNQDPRISEKLIGDLIIELEKLDSNRRGN